MKKIQKNMQTEFYTKVIREAYGDHPHRETICIALFFCMLTVVWLYSMMLFV